MQKKLIVVALAAAAFSTTALAETSNVSIYGTADLSYDIINTGNGAAANTAGVNKNAVSSNVSKLGFKGSEGLDDGLTAIWQIEQQINMDNTGGNFGTRNTFLGLKSDSAGTVLLGRHDTPYKISTRKLDIFGDSIADNRALMGGVSATNVAPAALAAAGKSAGASFDGRPTDVIAYISPALNGFTGALAYVAGAEATATAAQIKGSAWSLAGMYDAAPFYGSLAYEVHNLGTAGTGAVVAPGAALAALAGLKESATKLGFGYKIDALDLGLVYEKTSDNFGAAGANYLGHNAYYLSGKYSFGNDAVKLAYGKTGNLGAQANTGANQFSLGYDHGLSKRTKLYAIYSRISNQSGVNYVFSQTTATSANVAGASPSVFSFGMKHSF